MNGHDIPVWRLQVDRFRDLSGSPLAHDEQVEQVLMREGLDAVTLHADDGSSVTWSKRPPLIDT
jgi:hypothetical protein